MTLRRVWAEQYTDPPGPIRWRAVKELASPATLIASPYDVEARWSTKQSVTWIGYKVHITETCDADRPCIITHVETTPATTPDDQMLAPIHTALAARELLPQEHLVDAGYTDANVLLTSQQAHGVQVVGPVARDPSWQAKANNGFDISAFTVNWAAHHVICPEGKTSRKWIPGTDIAGCPIIKIHFARSTCLACSSRVHCTKSTVEPRSVTFRLAPAHAVLQARRKEQVTAAFKAQYAARGCRKHACARDTAL